MVNKKNTEELIAEAKKFFDTYKKEIGQSIREDKKLIIVNFEDLASFSHELAEELINTPEEVFQIMETALDDLGLIKNARVRFKNIPNTQKSKIGHIRAKHLNKLICIEGLVRQASDVRPQVVNAKFECPTCGTIISVLQIEKKFREPSRCSCGRKGMFTLKSKEMVDAQRLVIEESPESLEGGEQPRRLNVFLQEDLVEPKMEEKTTPGSKVQVIGTLKEIPVPLPTGSISTRFDLAIEANNIIPLEENFEEVKISDEDERQIQELAADPKVFEKMSGSVAPSIWGYDEIKRSLVLQMFGGVRKFSQDGSVKRGDIHILLIGDPGVAKSQTLKFISELAPKGRYIVGKAASGAGITATVVKDEFLRGWALEAGAMVLANKGIVCIDELEKMDPSDRSAMHEALEQQCMLPDFKLMLSNGEEIEIGKLVDNLIEKNKEKVIIGKDCEILSVNDIELLSTDFTNIFPLKADRISRHNAPSEFIKIILNNGREITVTPEHPCWTVEDGRIKTITAESLEKGMFFPVPSEILIKEQEYKAENDVLCKILGYHISDGCYELNRGKKTGIQFCNKDLVLIEDYKQAVEKFFGVKTGLTRRADVFSVRVLSKKVAEEIYKLDKNLMEKGIIKVIPEKIMQLPKENLKYLIRSLFDGDGTVTFQARNGCRTTLITENRKLSEQVADILLRFGIQSSIFKDREFFKLDITGQENLLKFLLNISFLSAKKKDRLKSYCEKDKSYKSIKDIIPNCTDKISSIFKKLKISMNKEIGHSIDLGVEKHRLFLQKLVLIAEKYATKQNNQDVLKEIKEIKKLAFGCARWIKVKEITRIKNEGIKWVYDVTMEPHRTFISNGMILHNTVTISKANVQACYSSDTEVLTEEGWKKYNEVKNLKIAQFNPKNNKIKFLSHKGLFVYSYNKEMYHFKDKRNDILVTPNHKMLFREPRHKQFQALEAENIKYNKIEFMNSGEYDHKEIKEFILPAIKHKQNRILEKYTSQHKDKKIPANLWLEFIGYYVTEGGKETAPTIGITQKQGENSKKIEKCLNQLSKYIGFTLTKIKSGPYNKFKITNTQLYNYLTENCDQLAHQKKLPLNVSEISKKQLKILFDAMMLGDGSKDGKAFGSTSETLANEFQILALLLGKSTSKHLAYDEKIRGNRKKFYRVVLSNQITPQIKRNSIKKLKYQGKVWCFSTETGFFITRRNGKIAIQGNTLQAQTSVLAAGNPKLGRFEPFQTIAQQIDLPPALINRFDVIFVLRDIPEKFKDEAIATHVLAIYQQKEKVVPVSRPLFRKYVAYAKQKIKPVLGDEAVKEIKEYYVKMRNQQVQGDAMGNKSIGISARQLEALVRLSEAHAKMRLSKKVTKEDARIAIEILTYYMKQVGYDEETKSFDIDRIATGVSSSQRSKVILLRETIRKLEERLGKFIPIEELEKELEGKLNKDDLDDSIQKLRASGDIFEPRKGFVQRI